MMHINMKLHALYFYIIVTVILTSQWVTGLKENWNRFPGCAERISCSLTPAFHGAQENWTSAAPGLMTAPSWLRFPLCSCRFYLYSWLPSRCFFLLWSLEDMKLNELASPFQRHSLCRYQISVLPNPTRSKASGLLSYVESCLHQ